MLAEMSVHDPSGQKQERMPLWVMLVVGIWILMLPAFLLIALGPPAWR
jgi:hypothetical protein